VSDFDGFDLVELHAEQSNLQLLLSLLLLEQTADQHYLKSQSLHEIVVGVLANSESHSDLIQAVELNLKSRNELPIAVVLSDLLKSSGLPEVAWDVAVKNHQRRSKCYTSWLETREIPKKRK
jgi:hypothetical protein